QKLVGEDEYLTPLVDVARQSQGHLANLLKTWPSVRTRKSDRYLETIGHHLFPSRFGLDGDRQFMLTIGQIGESLFERARIENRLEGIGQRRGELPSGDSVTDASDAPRITGFDLNSDRLADCPAGRRVDDPDIPAIPAATLTQQLNQRQDDDDH